MKRKDKELHIRKKQEKNERWERKMEIKRESEEIL